ncbi:Gfo/Idh/MocA family oxidoreductase [Streptomonospora sp. S1-112]|uniref:Gfo/Idh/MocA family oxidoreductase n=1 Tax=Streptomonospora mangrovi TaxID=2883123 RepID=A0A9X3NRS0_9ACTN|nr:Gfo/Idh/MocA family oxidoreductase [Streptomonospora mangrovi]MDA0565595.1 Gfo/Idh/MocA family oxidoreductase [Streptomonospora mangrovi]
MGLRTGLLGTGYWARETQGAALAAHPDVDLVGVWGRDAGRAQALADHLDTRAYTDADVLIGDVDAVAVALPPDVQAELALRAARAGRHLLLDKPVALSGDAAAALAAEAGRRGLASVVFFTMRFSAAMDAFLRETAATGGWTGAQATLLADALRPGSPYANSPWRRRKGGLWDIGPHALSLLLPVLGPVAEATAVAGPNATTHALLRHEGGAVSALALTLDAASAGRRWEFVFHGEHGVVSPPKDAQTPVAAFTAAIDELRKTLSGGGPSALDIGFGCEVVRVLEAAERAVTERRTVAVE